MKQISSCSHPSCHETLPSSKKVSGTKRKGTHEERIIRQSINQMIQNKKKKKELLT